MRKRKLHGNYDPRHSTEMDNAPIAGSDEDQDDKGIALHQKLMKWQILRGWMVSAFYAVLASLMFGGFFLNDKPVMKRLALVVGGIFAAFFLFVLVMTIRQLRQNRTNL